ncbi:MAG: DMT family transporter [Armatimonadetes bacterium]|nr:DMT family transporter [Armatimonadota bacterium]
MSREAPGSRVGLLTGVALCSFAANSLLCRSALRGGTIDPATFTVVRLVAGSVLLTVFAGRATWKHGDWASAAFLGIYAAAFSFAYLGLSAGTGALLLFGAVQATMLGVGMVRSERPVPREWAGLAVGLGGLVWLLFPGLTAPPLGPAFLMVLAGVAWGVYTLRGRRSTDAVATTAGNFVRAALLSLPLLAVPGASLHGTASGLSLAATSGAVTSGLGYVAWYAALRRLSGPRAAIVQLSVPVLAGLAGVLFLQESMTVRLAVATVLVVGGVALALTAGGSQPGVKKQDPVGTEDPGQVGID